ncbi:hypothetical protein CMO96_01390 [Candidatus Woesebacteria bacterium]|nr:hypothetical protein [Candidatus Woesebacteria bacterium]|tara:strand:- start:311 stop:883 length:573 start_codon:yes stop_codon:yes gene_type:complete
MRVYLFANPQSSSSLREQVEKARQILVRAGVVVHSNLDKTNEIGFEEQDNQSTMDRVDGLVIEGSSPSPEQGYLIALALAHKKPTICLLERGKSIDPNLKVLLKGREASQLLEVTSYTPQSLEKTLQRFIDRIETGGGREVPSIKFTLRITPRIERYLNWKIKGAKKTKADWLREMIEKVIDKDDKYTKR